MMILLQKQTTWFTKGLRQSERGLSVWHQVETNDLIYEGIATMFLLFYVLNAVCETNDLIYEGIATVVALRILSIWMRETNDLIYEGIATIWSQRPFRSGLRWNKRPDLRRDCDCRSRGLLVGFLCRNKRPDLRRDCDARIYEPDFVIETNNSIYLTEIKADNQIEQLEVQEKKKAALQYCKYASEHNVKNGGKIWKYLLIPHSEVLPNMSFSYLAAKREVSW